MHPLRPTHYVLAELQVEKMFCERLCQLADILYIKLHSEEHGEVDMAGRPLCRCILSKFAIHFHEDVLSVCIEVNLAADNITHSSTDLYGQPDQICVSLAGSEKRPPAQRVALPLQTH